MQKALSLFLFTLIFLLAGTLRSIGQENETWSYEHITFPDGKTEEYYVYFDSFKEWLYFKDEGEVRYFLAEDVVSFEYKGSRYFSLPFNSGKLSFFKVEFEGNKSALLSKPNSNGLMQYLATRYDKAFTLCGANGRGNSLKLCEVNYSGGGYGSLFQKYLEPVYIKECLFVVGEEGLKMFRVTLGKEMFLGMFKVDTDYTFESLEGLLGRESYRKIHRYARENKLKEGRLEDLKKVFQYYDNF